MSASSSLFLPLCLSPPHRRSSVSGGKVRTISLQERRGKRRREKETLDLLQDFIRSRTAKPTHQPTEAKTTRRRRRDRCLPGREEHSIKTISLEQVRGAGKRRVRECPVCTLTTAEELTENCSYRRTSAREKRSRRPRHVFQGHSQWP